MKPRAVVVSGAAEAQLDALHAYISEQAGEFRADAFISRVVSFFNSLAIFSERGTRRDDLRPGVRVIGYRRRAAIAFTVEPDAVVILGIYYGGQDYEAAFAEPDDLPGEPG
jgi:toxin ParE1/3/4